MRFNVIWLTDDGYADYAEHFEHPSLDKAIAFISRKLVRRDTIRNNICGFVVTYADSDFIRRYSTSGGSAKKRLTELCEVEIACKDLQHLIRPR